MGLEGWIEFGQAKRRRWYRWQKGQVSEGPEVEVLGSPLRPQHR